MQKRHNSSVLTIELHLFYTKPSVCNAQLSKYQFYESIIDKNDGFTNAVS